MRTFKVFLNNKRATDITREVQADRFELDRNGALIFYKNSGLATPAVVIRCWSIGTWYSFWEVV